MVGGVLRGWFGLERTGREVIEWASLMYVVAVKSQRGGVSMADGWARGRLMLFFFLGVHDMWSLEMGVVRHAYIGKYGR